MTFLSYMQGHRITNPGEASNWIPTSRYILQGWRLCTRKTIYTIFSGLLQLSIAIRYKLLEKIEYIFIYLFIYTPRDCHGAQHTAGLNKCLLNQSMNWWTWKSLKHFRNIFSFWHTDFRGYPSNSRIFGWQHSFHSFHSEQLSGSSSTVISRNEQGSVSNHCLILPKVALVTSLAYWGFIIIVISWYVLPAHHFQIHLPEKLISLCPSLLIILQWLTVA